MNNEEIIDFEDSRSYLAKLIDAARQDQDSAAAQEVVDPIQEQPQQQQEGPSQITLKSENDANLTMQMKGFAKDGMNRTVTIAIMWDQTLELKKHLGNDTTFLIPRRGLIQTVSDSDTVCIHDGQNGDAFISNGKNELIRFLLQ